MDDVRIIAVLFSFSFSFSFCSPGTVHVDRFSEFILSKLDFVEDQKKRGVQNYILCIIFQLIESSTS